MSVRRWELELDDELEFRCFVFHGQLTAISQYNHYCVLPPVVTRAEELQTIIAAFCAAEVSPRVVGPEYGTGYVVDVGVLPNGRCVVVELNPWKPTTGAALFDWRGDADLLHGRAVPASDPPRTLPDGLLEVGSPVLRLRTKPIPGLVDLVDVMLKEVQQSGEGQEGYLDVLERLVQQARDRQREQERELDVVEGVGCVCL